MQDSDFEKLFETTRQDTLKLLEVAMPDPLEIGAFAMNKIVNNAMTEIESLEFTTKVRK